MNRLSECFLVKRLACSLLPLLLAQTHLGFGQSTVDFRNGGVTFVTDADRRIYGFCEPNGLVGTNYVAALFYLPGADRGSQISSAQLAYGSNKLAYAYFRPPGTSLWGVWRNPAEVGNLRFLENVPPGESATLQVRVWDITLAPDWPSAVLSGQFLVTAPFNYTVPAPGSPAELYAMDNLRAAAVLVPCGPKLDITRENASAVVSWVPKMQGEILEETATLPQATWTPVLLPYSTSAGRVWVTNTITASPRFYRVRWPWPP